MNAPQRPAGHKAPTVVILRGRSLPSKNPLTGSCCHFMRERRPSQCPSEWPRPLALRGCFPFGSSGLRLTGYVALNMTPECFRNTTSSLVILRGRSLPPKNPPTAQTSPTARVNRPSPFDRLRAAPYRHGRAGATRLGDVSLHFVALNMTTVLFRELRGAGSRKEGGS
jgi:hypothetical protein